MVFAGYRGGAQFVMAMAKRISVINRHMTVVGRGGVLRRLSFWYSVVRCEGSDHTFSGAFSLGIRLGFDATSALIRH